MRPNGAMIQETILNFIARNTTIYRFQRFVLGRYFGGFANVGAGKIGTELPEQLVLLHEHTDHYSLQTMESVELEGNKTFHILYLGDCYSNITLELNKRLTGFLRMKGEQMTQKSFAIAILSK